MSDVKSNSATAWAEVGRHYEVDDHEFMGTVLRLSPEWRPATTQRTCRRQGRGHIVCGRPAVIELDRGRDRPQWWGYCERHTYGRILLDGFVYFVRPLRAGEATLGEPDK